MTNVDEILDAVLQLESCVVAPPSGLPNVADDLTLPPDVIRFYERAGGLIVNKNGRRGSRTRIVGPKEFDRIDVVITGEMFASGPFRFWHAVVDVQDGNYLAIDIGRDHNGACLDCFHETFAMPGYVSVVASSFTDLLLRLLNHQEDSAYWLQEEFDALGEGFALYGYEPLAYQPGARGRETDCPDSSLDAASV